MMCGSSADAADVAVLMNGELAAAMVTDPPYGIDYGSAVEARTKNPRDNAHIANDKLEDAVVLWAAAFPIWKACLRRKESAFYVWGPAGPQFIDLGIALRLAGLEPHGSIVWRKDRFVLARSDHNYQHECAWYGWRDDGTHIWHGTKAETSVWDFKRPTRSPDHPTQKPLGLIRRCVQNITRIGDLVVDPFLGSGTTLLAAETDGRRCFGMELDPKYVDVICRRWQEISGELPVLESTGEAHDFEVPTEGG